MPRTFTWYLLVASAATLLLLPGSSVFADKPDWAGGGKPPHAEKQKTKAKGNAQGPKGPAVGSQVIGGSHLYFSNQHRAIIRDYYQQQYRTGHCPPGLSKKNTGCLPPGQAKKWSVGSYLPGDVVRYEVPVMIARQLGQPPAGHKYVRVAADILLIAVGTGLIVDAIEDLGSL